MSSSLIQPHAFTEITLSQPLIQNEHEIYPDDKFIPLINVKMPTIIGILTFIRINTSSESFKARNIFVFQHFTFYQQLKFHAQLS